MTYQPSEAEIGLDIAASHEQDKWRDERIEALQSALVQEVQAARAKIDAILHDLLEEYVNPLNDALDKINPLPLGEAE